MKANQILKALNMPKSKDNQAHCSKLAKVYELLTEIKPDILTAEITGQNELLFGRSTEQYRQGGQSHTRVSNHGIKTMADSFKVITAKGEYCFAVPVDNSFHSVICELTGINHAFAEVIEPSRKRTNSILIDVTILSAIKKAVKFVSKDYLRPAMTCVCLTFDSNGKCEAVATNAHYLFMSELHGYVSEQPIKQLLLDAGTCKAIAAIKQTNDLPVLIDLFEGNKGTFEGIKFETFEDGYYRYPDYKCVVPDYKTSMRFDRKQMINSIAKVIKYANRATNQVNFHLNGKIELLAQDIDFDFQGESEMPYISKTFEDMDIAFCGKLLTETLSVFKDKEIEMQQNGINTKGSIFTDGKDRVLLMPLLLHS